ncbi:MAG: hypothetical protein Q9209_001473 [Squamulea sp. 1 TL-2023]
MIANGRRHKYATLKVCELDSPPICRELAAYTHLNTITTSNPGALLIRELLDSFKTSNSADLQAFNVHLRIEEDSILQEFEADELTDPSPCKVVEDGVIYKSRALRRPAKPGRPVLCDFSEARFGKNSYIDDIHPYIYRAPEVILDIPWTYSADIWNVGVMIWHIFEDNHLFNARDGNGVSSSLHHLADMVAVLGQPPLDFLGRSETSWKYFDKNGKWKGAVDIPEKTLAGSEQQLDGDNKALFLDLMTKMLQWVPESRQTAKQLLSHAWLKTG